MPIGIVWTFSGGDPRRPHETLHLAVRHLDAVDLAVPRAQGVEARIELRHPGRPRPSVEVREPEVVPVPLEVVLEQRELAQVEDRLVCDATRPAGRAEVTPSASRRPDELSRLVGQHPLGGLLLDEEP